MNPVCSVIYGSPLAAPWRRGSPPPYSICNSQWHPLWYNYYMDTLNHNIIFIVFLQTLLDLKWNFCVQQKWFGYFTWLILNQDVWPSLSIGPRKWAKSGTNESSSSSSLPVPATWLVLIGLYCSCTGIVQLWPVTTTTVLKNRVVSGEWYLFFITFY